MRTISKRNGFKIMDDAKPDLGVNINDPYVGKSTEHKIKGQIQYGDMAPIYSNGGSDDQDDSEMIQKINTLISSSGSSYSISSIDQVGAIRFGQVYIFAIAAGPSAMAKVNGDEVDEFDPHEFIYVISSEESGEGPKIDDSESELFAMYVYNSNKDRLIEYGSYSTEPKNATNVYIKGTYIKLWTDDTLADLFSAIQDKITPKFTITGDWITHVEEEEEEE